MYNPARNLDETQTSPGCEHGGLPIIAVPRRRPVAQLPDAGNSSNARRKTESIRARAPDGKPDFSGLWEMERNRPCAPEGCGDQQPSQEFMNIGWSLKPGLPYRPASAELVKARTPENRIDDPLAHCLPIGPVRLHTFTGFKKIAQTPGLLAILYEYNATYRQIMTDGRPLPADPNPSWNGYSTGKWEGETLVVDTTGFRDGLWLDVAGNPMTDAARMTERFRRVNYGTHRRRSENVYQAVDHQDAPDTQTRYRPARLYLP